MEAIKVWKGSPLLKIYRLVAKNWCIARVDRDRMLIIITNKREGAINSVIAIPPIIPDNIINMGVFTNFTLLVLPF